MVNLEDGWHPIIEELIRAELDMRAAQISTGGRSIQRLRNGLMARIDGLLEERFAAMLEETVSLELGGLSDAELCKMATDTDFDQLDIEVVREIYEAALERERRELGGPDLREDEPMPGDFPDRRDRDYEEEDCV